MAKGHSGKALIDILDTFLADGAKVLEIGSGPGTDWEILTDKYEVLGSDNSEEFIKHLQQTYPKGEFVPVDASTLELDRSFDAIYSNKVLHHLSDDDLKQSFERQQVLLKHGGVICHSFWRGEGSELFKGLFVNYHEKDDLSNLLEGRFEILHFELYPEFEKEDSLLLIARKK